MGQCIDESYEPLNELIDEINMILSQLEGSEGKLIYNIFKFIIIIVIMVKIIRNSIVLK